MILKHLITLLMLVLVFSLGLAGVGHAAPFEIIQYEVSCDSIGNDELSVKVVNFSTASGGEDVSFCDFEEFDYTKCNLTSMAGIVDAIENTPELKCVRTYEGSADNEWGIATTCTGKRDIHAKAIRRACRVINELTGFTP